MSTSTLMPNDQKLNREYYSVPVRSRRKRKGLITKVIMNYRGRRQAEKIMRSLHEAKQIHAGKLPIRSLADFLKDF